jgi:ethanolamine utilization protein EutP (predicted NTPase)
MKSKHNKKRNTGFIFESLVREATLSILKGDVERKTAAVNILKKHFKTDGDLNKHFQCYRALYAEQNVSPVIAEKILHEAKMASRLIDPSALFKQQSALISDINKDLSPAVFNTFVPNYKTLATIDQIFSNHLSPKQRVMLENTLVVNMTKTSPLEKNTDVIDTITLNSFAAKFNDKYDTLLAEEQKTLLGFYITSFTDNAVELKTFLNEEISRLKTFLQESDKQQIFTEDSEMNSNIFLVVEKLETFKNTAIDESVLFTVLKTQQLVKELTNGSHN